MADACEIWAAPLDGGAVQPSAAPPFEDGAARIAEDALRDAGVVGPAWLLFHEAGLEGRRPPLPPASTQH